MTFREGARASIRVTGFRRLPQLRPGQVRPDQSAQVDEPVGGYAFTRTQISCGVSGGAWRLRSMTFTLGGGCDILMETWYGGMAAAAVVPLR